MKLKRIKVAGFKSFADKVTLEFHDGVTGIVGPNGCGKSNIADAFRWVMGEQSAKSMRGGKMQDILFAGTTKRKALGLAEVSLVFENTEGKVGIPYHEVEITRRYHRDGEAEYLLNGNLVRLKDIHSILIDVGIGKNAYAIFEQGKIDQIIQLGPEERRSLFEEAAGILKFLLNRREAEKKLAEVELNCTRLQDIHDEVQKEIDHLAGQAARAKEYQALKEKKEALEEECLSLKITSLQNKKSMQGLHLQEQEARKKAIEEKCQLIKQEVEEKRALLEEEESALKAKERALYEVKARLDVHQKEHETLTERLKEHEKRASLLESEKKALLETRAKRKAEALAHTHKQSELSSGLKAQEALLIAAKEAYLASEQKVIKGRREVDKAQESLLLHMRQVNESSSLLKDKERRVETLLEKISFTEKEIERHQTLQHELSAEEKERQKGLEEASLAGDQARESFHTIDGEIKKLTTELEQVEQHDEMISHQLVEMRAREKVLLRLREEMEGASQGTKELLKEAKKESSPFYGKLRGLWEYFDIQPGFEEAVAAVLRPYGDTLVADTKETWQGALAWAQAHKLSDFSLVALGQTVETNTESSLLKKVKMNAATSHFLKGKAVVENLEAALNLLNRHVGEVFSQDGYFIDKSAVLFRTSQKGSSVFLREAELKTLTEKIKDLQVEVEAYKTQSQLLREKRQAGIEKRQEWDKKVRSLEMQLVEKNFQLQRATSELERVRKNLLRLEEERAKFKGELFPLQGELIDLKDKNTNAENHLKKCQEQKETLQQALDEALSTHRQLSEARKEEESRFSQVGDEARKILHALNLLEVKEQESLSHERRIGEEQKELESACQSLSKKQKELLALIHMEEKDCETLHQEKEKLGVKLNEKKEKLKTHWQKLSEEEEKYKKESQKGQNIELQIAQLVTQLEMAFSEFSEKCPGKSPRALEGTPDQSERELKRLKELLLTFKDINLAAVESLDQHMSRKAHLQKEMGDLTGATSELKAIIGKLADESKTLFLDTFEAIRTHFKKNFQILFEGGEADLELTNPENVLQSGVEIVAKPPGKQMRSIHLLSGGEKCLTAMALLFSIFEVKAAPFCILDEIDAPLDDTNVDRFCKMVKHFADRSQFILITHNKRTMAMADRLYGVSMEEKGVSKMLMMEFHHHAAKDVSLV